MNDQGVWIVFLRDGQFRLPLYIGNSELDALRYAVHKTNYYDEINVVFWPFGTEFTKIEKDMPV